MPHRLLQRQCVSQALGVSFEAVTIQLTRGRKPFYAGGARHPGAPNFNFNVSHEVGLWGGTTQAHRHNPRPTTPNQTAIR